MFAKRYEDPPEVWGVSRVVVDGDVTPWPVAEADIEDEAESLAPRLAALGLEPGGLALVVAMLSQAVHAVPFERAAGKLGALYSSADATPFDAFRVAVLVRQLEPQVVVGITSSVLDGLVEAGRDPAEVLGPVPAVVTADDDAHTRLRAAGLSTRLSRSSASTGRPATSESTPQTPRVIARKTATGTSVSEVNNMITP